jgi:hypothetical protein
VQIFLLYHRQNYDSGPEALGLGRAARYFAAEVDGIDREGTNQRGTARAHPVLQRCTGQGVASSKDEQAVDLST